jgi:hypothetical protein
MKMSVQKRPENWRDVDWMIEDANAHEDPIERLEKRLNELIESFDDTPLTPNQQKRLDKLREEATVRSVAYRKMLQGGYSTKLLPDVLEVHNG